MSNNELDCWMSKLPPEKQKIPLNQLLIPGSHDSFSYSLKMGEIGPDVPYGVSVLAAIPFVAGPTFLRWAVTQRSTVYEQLTHGVRYFDIRVAVHNKKFYIVHLLFGEDLQPLLKEVKNFLDLRPGEVVLLDFQHFYGLTTEDHFLLISLVKKQFPGLICPPFRSLSHLSLSYLSKSKHQVLVFYRNKTMQRQSGFWSGDLFPNPWPQTTRVSSLMPFVKNGIKKRMKHKFFVTQCVLTPTVPYIAKNLFSSLEKKLAIPCNERVFDWIVSLDSEDQKPNVVMTDFVEYNDWAIPKAIIQHNFCVSHFTEGKV